MPDGDDIPRAAGDLDARPTGDVLAKVEGVATRLRLGHIRCEQIFKAPRRLGDGGLNEKAAALGQFRRIAVEGLDDGQGLSAAAHFDGRVFRISRSIRDSSQRVGKPQGLDHAVIRIAAEIGVGGDKIKEIVGDESRDDRSDIGIAEGKRT